MENLFFLVVVLIIIVSNVISIRKRIKTQQSGQKDEARPGEGGWKSTIEKVLSQLKEEFEPQAGKSSGRERISGEPGEGFFEEAYPEPEPLTRHAPASGTATGHRMESKIDQAYRMKDGRERRTGGSQTAADSKEHRFAMAEKESREAADAGPKETSSPEEKPAEEFARMPGYTYSVAQLQRAVIWSEILGSPVALQKERREVW